MQTPAISKHLKNIFEEKELDECAIISKMETIQLEGNRQITRLVGYFVFLPSAAVVRNFRTTETTHKTVGSAENSFGVSLWCISRFFAVF